MLNYPRPPNFKPVSNPKWVEFSNSPPAFLRNPPRRGKYKWGIIYEEKCQELLERRFDFLYIRSPWLNFADEHSTSRWAQPDGLVVDPRTGTVTILEIKYRHGTHAWFQLFHLYEPLIRHLFPRPEWTTRCVEVCRWFDPNTAVPEPIVMREHIQDAIAGKFNVHIVTDHDLRLAKHNIGV